MKRILTVALMAITFTAIAQEKSAKWYDNIKFSGYGMLQYQTTDKYSNTTVNMPDGTTETLAVKHHDNTFHLRLLRMSLDGKIGNFDWKVQIQGTNVKGAEEATVMLIDLYTEWVRYEAVRVKVGQFKRPFTFENPTHPVTQGWYAYAQVIHKLSAFGDRTGEHSSAGRDIGVQLQGDVLKNASGRNLLHYQVGIFNGEGINSKDKDDRKDVIGGLWVMPVKGLRIGAFGWTGNRADVGGKNRYALSAEYDKDEYTFRTEYIHSQGMGADPSLGDKADGWYIHGIVPVIKGRLHAKARYQTYRDNKEWNRAKTMYEMGLNYFFTKNLQLNVEYARVNDRTIADPDRHSYNFFDAQLDFRF